MKRFVFAVSVLMSSVCAFAHRRHEDGRVNKILCFFMLFWLPLQLFSQIRFADNDAKDNLSAPYTRSEIKDFYRCLVQGLTMKTMLIRDDIIKTVISKEDEITQGYDLDDIYRIIDDATAFTDGEWIDTIVALSFPNGNTIYHQLSDGAYNHIWLPNGCCLFDNSSNPWMFMRPAIINDTDGYVNIRERPSAHSKIVRTIKEDELFYFTPISKAEWYPVYIEERLPCIGFIHKSRIKTYGDFPEWLKKIVKELRGGC